MQLERGHIAVVTGGAGGIGLALAADAAEKGLHVVLVDLRADALESAAAELRSSGAEVTAIVADVSRADEVERVALLAFSLGPVQLVCSNAGIVVHGRSWEVSASDWERVIGVNFMATVHVVRAFVPRLLEAGAPAHLLVTGSMASVTALPSISPYVAAKHGLLGLCEALHYELAGTLVGVTLLMPGKVATGMSRFDNPEAITPGESASIALAAVARGQVFAFTHPDRIAEAERRFAAILEQRAPGPALANLGDPAASATG